MYISYKTFIKYFFGKTIFLVEKKYFFKIDFYKLQELKKAKIKRPKTGKVWPFLPCFPVHHGRVGGLQFWLGGSKINIFFLMAKGRR